MSTISRRLPSGAEVLLRPIPPHHRRQLDVSSELPEEPELPQKEVKSVDGHVERMPAAEGDPEYEAWLQAHRKWLGECAVARKRLYELGFLERLDYAIVGWILPGPLQSIRRLLGLWSRNAPRAWEAHPALKRVPMLSRRTLYITGEVLTVDADYDVVTDAAFPLSITSSEVDAQLDGFRPESGTESEAPGDGDQGAGEPTG